jgi:uncharacterized membrane protein YkoI
MKKLMLLLLSLSLIGMLVFADDKDANKAKKEVKTKVEVKDIPKAVLDAAKEKVKGFEAKSAVVEDENGGKEYEIKGTANGKPVEIEIEVDKDGKVTKVEVETKKEGEGDAD